MNESIKLIKENILPGSTIIVGVSGGPDSMCLLNLLIDMSKENNYDIVVSHINHNLREESEEEYEFVKNFSTSKGLKFEGIKLGEFNKAGIENEARNRRYSFYEELLTKYNSKYLLLAHHGDDLVETILMRLTRGSTLDGYSGFSKISQRDNYVIIRPLTFYTKDEILKYLENNNIEYRVDKSNFDKKYTRNRYRLDILPVLKNENINIHRKYLSFSEELNESNNFIQNYVENCYKKIVINNEIDINKLLKEDNYIIKKIINKYLFVNYKDDIKFIETKHVNYILEVIHSSKPNITISMPNNYAIIKNYNILYLSNNIEKNGYNFILEDKVITKDFEITKLTETDLTNNFVCHLNSEDIKLPINVRNRKDGDFIEILNLNGKKKIKDLFIDEKIPKEERDKYPIVVDSNDNILWVPGLKKSKYDSLKKGKYDIILWYTRRNNNE